MAAAENLGSQGAPNDYANSPFISGFSGRVAWASLCLAVGAREGSSAMAAFNDKHADVHVVRRAVLPASGSGGVRRVWRREANNEMTVKFLDEFTILKLT